MVDRREPIRKFITGHVEKLLNDTSLSCFGTLTAEKPDRMGEIVVASGGDFKNFLGNPMALLNHDPDQIIGKWSGIMVRDKEVVGTLNFPEPGISQRADEVRGLVKAGIISAISIGFIPLAWEPIKGSGALKFTRWELLEASLVAVPALPQALISQRKLAPPSREERMAEAALLAKELQLIEAGFGVVEARHFARRSRA